MRARSPPHVIVFALRFAARLWLSLAISNSWSNLWFLHGFILSWSNSSSFGVFWLGTPNQIKKVVDSNRNPTPVFFLLPFFSFLDYTKKIRKIGRRATLARGMGIPSCNTHHREVGNGWHHHVYLTHPHRRKSHVTCWIATRRCFRTISYQLAALRSRNTEGPKGQGYWQETESAKLIRYNKWLSGWNHLYIVTSSHEPTSGHVMMSYSKKQWKTDGRDQ